MLWQSCLLSLLLFGSTPDDFEHGYADSGGVKIHYATLGEGPLVVMLHGFPDYWYTWHRQMRVLAKDHKVVAIDMRGYNKSDKPKGVAKYAMRLLVGDVVAVIRHFGRKKATIVGHDWGGAVAWQFAMHVPQMTERLIVCNLPHPRGMMRELRKNAAQRKSSQYARDFQKDGAHENLTAESLARWVKDPKLRVRYVEAFRRSDFEAMTNYYKANYPSVAADTDGEAAAPMSMPRVRAPVLMIYGLDDKALLPSALNGTWNWLDSDLTLVTIPKAGHFVQHDAHELVSRSMRMWLRR